MIQAILYEDEVGRLVAYSAMGHAGYARRGHDDIVCAAVSILGATVVNSLEALCGVSTDDTVIANDSGMLSFVLPEDLDLCQIHDAGLLMHTLQQGLRDIEGQYPKNLKLSTRPIDDLRSSKNGGRRNDQARSSAIRS